MMNKKIKKFSVDPRTRYISLVLIGLSVLQVVGSSIVLASNSVPNGFDYLGAVVVLLPGTAILLLGIYLRTGWHLRWLPFLFIFLLAFVSLLWIESGLLSIMSYGYESYYFDHGGTSVSMLQPLDWEQY